MWVAKLTVWPGEATRVASVDLQITGAIDQDPQRQQRLRQAREAFGIQPGSVFRQAEWERAKQDAVHSLHHQRYAAARIVDSRADVDPDAHTARLSVHIDSGPPFRFGTVTVTGLERYPPSIVTNLNPIRPGSPYDENELLKFQRRLLASGYFASAVVAAGSDPAQANATPIRVTVVEGAARKLGLGLGYSTDRGLRAVAQYTDKNTFDRALRFSGSVQVDQVGQNADGRPVPAAQRAGSRVRRRGQVQLSGHREPADHRLERHRRAHLHRRGTRVTAIPAVAAASSTSSPTGRAIAPQRCISRRPGAGTTSTTWWRRAAATSSRCSWAAPRRRCCRTPASGGCTPRAPICCRCAASARSCCGPSSVSCSRSRGQRIPSAYVFRTGGDNTVRGYAYESLGVPQGGSIVGGRYLGVGSVEYIQWIRPEWGAAVFVDAGNAVDDLHAFDVALGYGVGARWRSPIGTINLDVAYGQQVESWRLHFSAGIVLR